MSRRCCTILSDNCPSGISCQNGWYYWIFGNDWIFWNYFELHSNVNNFNSNKNISLISIYFRIINWFNYFSAVLERLQIESASWSTATPVVITALVFYCITQFVFFSLVPVILFESGATALQLFLLTADFFNVLLGMLTHQYKVKYIFTFVGN